MRSTVSSNARKGPDVKIVKGHGIVLKIRHLYAISDDLEFLKAQIARLPSRAWLSRMGLIGLASIWTLILAVALILI